MKVRVFYPNKENKIVFTKEQLEKLLQEVYDEGHADGYIKGWNSSSSSPYITYPYTPVWYGTGTGDNPSITTPTITCTNNAPVTFDASIYSNTVQIGDKE